MTTRIEDKPVAVRNPPGRCPSILVVDDDKYMRALLQAHLTQAGYRVVLAEDSIVARHLLPGFAPDLLIINVQMPYRNGLDLVYTVLEDRAVPRVPVMFISSYGQFASTARVLSAGFLLKPFHKDELLDTVSRSLAGTRTGNSWHSLEESSHRLSDTGRKPRGRGR